MEQLNSVSNPISFDADHQNLVDQLTLFFQDAAVRSRSSSLALIVLLYPPLTRLVVSLRKP